MEDPQSPGPDPAEALRRRRAQVAKLREDCAEIDSDDSLRMRIAQRLAELGSWEWSFQTGDVWWSDEMYRILGVDAETFEPSIDGFLSLVGQEDRGRVLAAIERSILDCRDYVVDCRIITSLGVRKVRMIGHVELDATGVVTLVSGTVQDVTEQHRDADSRIAAVMRSACFGVWEYDVHRRSMFWSDELLALLGIALDDFDGSKDGYLNTVHSEDRPVVEADLEAAIRLGSKLETRFRVVTEGGEIRHVRASAEPCLASTGEVTSMAGVIYDETGLRLEGEQRSLLERQLQQAQKLESVGLLAGGIAHDFNNLLQIVLGYGGYVLENDCTGEERVSAVEGIMTAAGRARDLTHRLLAFSRRTYSQPIPLDLNELVESRRSMLVQVLGRDVEIDFIPGRQLGTVNADASELEQVLINLVTNARDAMGGSGRLTIETENVVVNGSYCRSHPWAKPGRYVLWGLADTGRGMAPELCEKVFEPFYTTKEVGAGPGLGLSMVYGIIKNHEGMIHVYSEPEIGTQFKVYLPIVERPAISIPSLPAGPVPRGTETILVADDEGDVLELARRTLESHGYRVLTARDGVEALQVFRQYQDLIGGVLLDSVMPRMNGREVFEAIRILRPRVAALFMSGYTRESLPVEFLARRGCEIVPKPFDPDSLLRKLRMVIDLADDAPLSE